VVRNVVRQVLTEYVRAVPIYSHLRHAGYFVELI
jgi:hypothetical protein